MSSVTPQDTSQRSNTLEILPMVFWLILLGILTYVVVRRSVVDITRTPVWLLWAVMMMPAFIWTAWTMVNGEADVPMLLLVAPLIGCPVIYWLLIQWGRPKRHYSSSQRSESPSASESRDISDGTSSAKQAGQVMAQLSTPTQPPPRPINKEDEEALKSCFPWGVYYLRNIEYRPQAVVCKGSLRTSPEKAYKTIWANIQRLFEDRFLLVFQEGLDGKPFFTLVPNTLLAQRGKPLRSRPAVALALLAATLLTTTLAGVLLSGVAADDLQASASQLSLGLPYSLSLLAILAIHELSHYIAARRYGIKATLPYFIPVPPATIFPFGTFGAFIQTRSPLPHRKALFDVGISGPLAGFIVTVPILLWGLAHSTLVPLTEESGIFNFESFSPTSSLLIALLSRLALGSQLMTTNALELHPVAIAGCLGMVVTALNLIPVGQLDGGHIVHAMFGQRAGVVIGQVARLLVLALAFVQNELLVWAILLFFMPIIDEPALNDVSELDNTRDFLGLFTLALLVLILLPAPQVIARLLFTAPVV